MELLDQIQLILNQKGIDREKLSELTGWTTNQIRTKFKGGMKVKDLMVLSPIIEKDIKLQ